jgi:hypothetical protein
MFYSPMNNYSSIFNLFTKEVDFIDLDGKNYNNIQNL